MTFTDTSTDLDGNITSWHWDFRDRTSSVASSPTHEYEEEGDYTVKLTVTDNDGGTDSVTHTITIGKDDNGTPGFEMALLVIALLSLTYCYKRRR